MKYTPQILKALAIASLVIGLSDSRAAVIYATDSKQINFNSTTSTVAVSSSITSPRVGGTYTSPTTFYTNAVFVFQLPDLGEIANPFSDVSLDLSFAGYPGGGRGGNIGDLYGIGVSSSSTVTSSMYYLGLNDTTSGVVKLAGDFLNSSSYATGASFSASGSSVTDYLNSVYAGGDNAGSYVFFRINPQSNPPANNATGYNLYGVNAGSDSLKPMLNYTAVPEPTIGAFLLVSLGVVFLRMKKAKTLVEV